MAEPQHSRSYRINPVEIAIFSVVTLIFCNSMYNLFYDRRHLGPAAMIATTHEDRSPAATAAQSFQNLEIRCTANADLEVSASRIRLTGPLCDTGSKSAEKMTEAAKLVRTQIINNTNKFSATVFTDLSSGRFSTDYITLNPGRNSIQIEFTFEGGRVFTQTLSVQKN